MDQVPNSVPARLQAKATGNHPDLDLLAALAEQALPERERAQVLLHLSRCADCREVLALALPPVEASSTSLDTARRPGFRWPVLRWAAAAACVVIVGSAVLMKRESIMSRSMQTARIESDAKSAASRDERVAEPGQPPVESVHPPALATSGPETKVSPPAQEKSARQSALQGALGPHYAQRGATGMTATSGPGAAGGMGATGGGAFRRYPAAPAVPGPLQGTPDELMAKMAPKAAGKDFPTEGRPMSEVTLPRAADEQVAAEAAAPAAGSLQDNGADQLKREAPGKAKAPAARMMLDRMEASGNTVQALGQNQPSAEASRAKKSDLFRAVSSNLTVSRWTISSDGKLQHSIDSGKTWQPVPVAENAVFRALSANGPDLWVGGAAGLLYHSPDAGGRWTQIKPVSGGSTLAADIAAIEFTDIRQGKVTTANGEIWTTSDGGQSWRKQP
jgi:hypothetical protein